MLMKFPKLNDNFVFGSRIKVKIITLFQKVMDGCFNLELCTCLEKEASCLMVLSNLENKVVYSLQGRSTK